MKSTLGEKDSLESLDSQQDHVSYTPKSSLANRGTKWLLIFSLLANSLFIVGFALWQHRPLTRQLSSEFRTKINFDERDLSYQSLSYEYDDLWNGKFSTANGSGILDLPDSEHTEGFQRLGGIAMFHQLHCLWIVRDDIRKAINGESIQHNWRDAGHGNHCLDYLRKSILCFADPTIERPSAADDASAAEDGGIALDILGHETRMCRSSESLYALRKGRMIKQDH